MEGDLGHASACIQEFGEWVSSKYPPAEGRLAGANVPLI